MSIKPSTYLYGQDLHPFRTNPYEDVLVKKIALANKVLHQLVRVDNMNDTRRINKVREAIKFNTSLLNELGYDNKQIKQRIENA